MTEGDDEVGAQSSPDDAGGATPEAESQLRDQHIDNLTGEGVDATPAIDTAPETPEANAAPPDEAEADGDTHDKEEGAEEQAASFLEGDRRATHPEGAEGAPQRDTDMGDNEDNEGTSLASTEVGQDTEESLHQEPSAGAQTLMAQLERISAAKNAHLEEMFSPTDFPESYRQNTAREKLVLMYADNYRRQYIHLYRDRKPLLLCPLNELGVEKFVCTTMHPVELPFKPLYQWEGAAQFVADYLNYVPIDPEHELPPRLYAPSTVLQLQRGHCFEYSTLLASLLIGAGYDAYVVSGYSGRETCLLDQTYDICPLLNIKPPPPPEPEPPVQRKYTVRPPKDLTSKFELKQEMKRLQQIKDQQDMIKAIEDERIRVSELPPVDPLYGLRVHSWVLVLAGKREVAEGFFIEPTTGLSHALDTELYLGLESVWNHRNYWANMQDCANGIAGLRYDLGDCALWEYMFPSNDKSLLLLPGQSGRGSKGKGSERMGGGKHIDFRGDHFEDEEEEEKEEDIEKHMDLPPSWTQTIVLSPADFEKRCPGGKKLTYYKRTKHEIFAPYLLKDGLVSRLSIYDDLKWTNLVEVREEYANRADKLQQRLTNYSTGWITETFSKGRAKHLREHQYRVGGALAESERVMLYYEDARVDGLAKLEETPLSLTQVYFQRDDYLRYRYVQFGPRQKKFGPAETSHRPIEVMLERYERNPLKDANEDVEEVIYHLMENKDYLTYHKDRRKISASTREFTKPLSTDDKGAGIIWNTDSHSTFQSDPAQKDKKKAELYQMMMSLLQSEAVCLEAVRDAEAQVRSSLDERMREEGASELEVSIFDTQRNDKALKHRAELERQELEAKMQSDDTDQDYLAPLLARLDPKERITRSQAIRLREEALAELRQQLVDKANRLQARNEKATVELHKRQLWYSQNQVSMTKVDEANYLNFVNEMLFRIHILELRFNRHKELAPIKYAALERKLLADPRLTEYMK